MDTFKVFALISVFTLELVTCQFVHSNAPIVVNPVPAPHDRSVYARRNFGQPNVASPVYEVFVGPSNYDTSRSAVVHLEDSTTGLKGLLEFKQERHNAPVHITGQISGLTPGLHGMHIHEKGDMRNGCKAAGGHFNPYMQTHGGPQDRARHIGDLGNIFVDNSGVANVNIMDSLISLAGVNSIIGRAVVVHEKEDDLGKGGDAGSLKTGNAGGRLACGVIGLI